MQSPCGAATIRLAARRRAIAYRANAAMDTKHRCSWSEHDPLMRHYHDTEWGVPERDARASPTITRRVVFVATKSPVELSARDGPPIGRIARAITD